MTSDAAGPEELKVLDKGFVRLVDVMGDDAAVVLAARVSYGAGLKGTEKDRKLLHYLLRHQHMSPFEQAVFKFHVKLPIFVTRQWIRHRMASYNEISARYSETPEEFYVPDAFRAQDLKNKQSSVPGAGVDQARARKTLEDAHAAAFKAYQDMLGMGVARELARLALPVSLYTQFYWTVNARSLMHFLDLRADAAAQWEIQRYAEALAGVFARRMPWTWEAFLLYSWKGSNPSFDARKAALAAPAQSVS